MGLCLRDTRKKDVGATREPPSLPDDRRRGTCDSLGRRAQSAWEASSRLGPITAVRQGMRANRSAPRRILPATGSLALRRFFVHLEGQRLPFFRLAHPSASHLCPDTSQRGPELAISTWRLKSNGHCFQVEDSLSFLPINTTDSRCLSPAPHGASTHFSLWSRPDGALQLRPRPQGREAHTERGPT